MVISRSRWVGHNNFHAAVRCVVLSLAFFTIVVANIVRILLVKLEKKYVKQKSIFFCPVHLYGFVFSKCTCRVVGVGGYTCPPSPVMVTSSVNCLLATVVS